MNALADKIHKQGMPHSDTGYALHNTATYTLFNNHPYISSSSADWHATATYVGMVVECGRVDGVHITVWHSLLGCVLCQPEHSLIQSYIG